MKRHIESQELFSSKNSDECNAFELLHVIQPKEGSKVLFGDVHKALKCLKHRDCLNSDSKSFFERKRHIAKILGFKKFFVDEK